MKMFRLGRLPDVREGHFLSGIVPGKYIYEGGLAFAPPGSRAHTSDGSGGRDWHVHEDEEVFVMLGGKARMELNGKTHDLSVGDVCIIQPGEDHHIISDEHDPSVHIWFHAGPQRHKDQRV
jgi:mannose-6-phosphate isomerase-like protein (cupin superfamily)